MSEPRAEPWVAIIGIGEDGLPGLTDASRVALQSADIVFGGPRHLLLAAAGARGRAWPAPFSIEPVLAERGHRVAVLASGDPFWFGAGGTLARHLSAGEWVAYPAPSTFSLAAARLGWRLEDTTCLGLHAAPFEQLEPVLARGAQVICLVRDGAAVATLAAWLSARGFGPSSLWLLEALGGAAERIRATTAANFDVADIAAPVAVAILAAGAPGLPRGFGLPDECFEHDDQITKRPIRALTLSALAPRPGEMLWDIGAGSGSIAVEWCLAGGSAQAIEQRPSRAENIAANAARFGIAARLRIVTGTAPDALAGLPRPDAVFIGGGANAGLLDALWPMLPGGTRLVANAVTLETEALLTEAQARHGGGLMRIELAKSAPLGGMRGWEPARPVVQWSAVR